MDFINKPFPDVILKILHTLHPVLHKYGETLKHPMVCAHSKQSGSSKVLAVVLVTMSSSPSDIITSSYRWLKQYINIGWS